MPRTIGSFGDAGQDREIDALWEALERLGAASSGGQAQGPEGAASSAPTGIVVQELDADPSYVAGGISFDQADGFVVSRDSTLDTYPKIGKKQIVRKNSGGSDYTRRRLNLIESTGITLTLTDDSGNDEVDIAIAASGGGAVNWSVAIVSASSYTVLSTDTIVICTNAGGCAVTLPAASSNSGKIVFIIRKVNAGGEVNISVSGGDTIYGQTRIAQQGISRAFVSDGVSGWHPVAVALGTV